MSNHSASPLEPSMEDILASIRRIIAEEDEQEARNAARRAAVEEPPVVETRQAAPPPAPPPPPVREPAPEAPRAEIRPEIRVESRPEPRLETPSPAPRSELRAEIRSEARELRAEPPAFDWSGLGAETPPARHPEPPPRRESEFSWLDGDERSAERIIAPPASVKRPEPEAERASPAARFDFEMTFRDSDDSDLDADLSRILKPSTPPAPPPERPEAAAPRVVESAYGGRFVEAPPRVAEPLAPAAAAAPRPSAPPPPPVAGAASSSSAAADPFARFLNPPPSAFDDGYTLDPEAEPITIESPVSALGRKARDAFDAVGEAATETGAGAFKAVRNFAEETFVDPAAKISAKISDKLESAGSAVASGLEATTGAVSDVAASAFRGASETLGQAGRALGETAETAADLAEGAGRAVKTAAKSSLDAAKEAVREAAPEAPKFDLPKFDLPDFDSLRGEIELESRRATPDFGALRAEIGEVSASVASGVEEARRETSEAFRSIYDSLPEAPEPPAAPPPRRAEEDALRDALAAFGPADRFSREDLDDGVLNLTGDRRILEAPSAGPAQDSDSFWSDDFLETPRRDSAALDIPAAPDLPDPSYSREELLLTQRLGEVEPDPLAGLSPEASPGAKAWDSGADAAKIAAAVAAQAAASSALATQGARSRVQESASSGSLVAAPSAARRAVSAEAEEELLSEASERASARAMAALNSAVTPKPRLHGQLRLLDEEGEGETLNALVRQMLKPMLREWLDDNLPSMVERLVRAEVERVSARAAWSDAE